MRTAYISHHDCLLHDTGIGHPERTARIHAIEDRLKAAHLFDFLQHRDAPEVTDEQLLRVHDQQYLDQVAATIPAEGLAYLDPDTPVCPHSLEAARRAAGAVVLATDMVIKDEVANAFCCVRPPGHHAERTRAMGFCLFGNIAVGVAHALEEHGVQRVAILDFDVHHGNGSEDIFLQDDRVLVCSSYQYPFYPYSEIRNQPGHIVHATLPGGSGSRVFREAITSRWLPELEAFKPEMIFVSAGFDAHVEDEMSGIALTEADYRWVTDLIVRQAEASAQGRIVSALEGGYALSALGRSVEAHLRGLMGL